MEDLLLNLNIQSARNENPEKILVYIKQGVDREPLLKSSVRRVEHLENGY